ncbi:RHS repeat-associated core domain-containing protein [Arenimonas terrae]|uniref:RHS repeat protein n=1 Tax=Arenimonas terrae TaxID=2546226 RepID=A0A5C4RU55_9GAMM|nr:RHS repeat-associated core domain-containing protein [Arenimonas terrae]TNJ34494.1 RHS repeat protein [Arenimonas terrae]
MNLLSKRFRFGAHSVVIAFQILAAWLLLNPTVAAQDIWSYSFNGGVYDSRDEAVSAMRASHPHGSLLQPESTRVINYGASTVLRTTYSVPYQPPQVISEPSYTIGGWGPAQGICAPSSADPTRCANEAEMMAGKFAHYQQAYPTCTITPYYATGSYASPYHTVSQYSGHPQSARIQYTFPSTEHKRLMEFDMTCGDDDEPNHHEDWMSMEASMTCPSGMVARSGKAPAYSDGNNEVAPHQMCRSTAAKPYIDSTVLQVACEPGNCNPVYPGTGDKARFETDFVFAGREFGRSYHSLQQEDPTRTIDISGTSDPMRTLAPGWQHSYTDKLYAERNPKTLYSDRGYYDFFRSVATGIFRSETNPDKVLRDFGGGYRLIEPDGSTKEFDYDGNLTRVYHPDDLANAVTLAYDGMGRLTTITDAKGRALTLLYDPGSRLLATRTDMGEETLYGYDANGNLTSVERPDGSVRVYHYGETGLAPAGFKHHLTGITDERGNRMATFGYDNRGRAILSRLNTGNPGSPTHDMTTVAYTGGFAATVTRATGESVDYTFSSHRTRRTLSRTDGDGEVEKTYDSTARLLSLTEADGTTTTFGYADTYTNSVTESVNLESERRRLMARDARHRIISTEVQSKVAGVFDTESLLTAAYEAAGQIRASCAIDPDSANASYVCGSLASAPSGVRQTLYAYCDATDVAAPNSTCPILGLLKSMDGPRTDVADTASFEYRSADDLTGCSTGGACHRKGDLYRVTDATGAVTTYSRYDLAGRPLQVVDANGIVTDLEYNVRGWLTARKVRGADNGTEADDAITRLDYDNVGQVTKVTQPDGAFVEFSYDQAHRLTGIEDNFGNTVSYTLDGAGHRISEETRDAGNVLRHSLSRVYDQLGQLETLADALSTPTDFTYDAVGQVDTVTDAFGRTTDHDYDPLGRLKRSIANVGGTGPERAETQFQYDARDNLTAVIDPKGLTTSYGYNGLGDLVTLASPDTGTTTYTYDAAGNRASQTDARGITTIYGYDALNRLTALDLPTPGQDIGFSYDTAPTVCVPGETFASGRLSGFTDPSGSTAYCYDRRGNVVRKLQSVTGTPDATVGYTHNAANRLVAMTYPSGAVVTYQRDAAGRITGVMAQPTAGSAAVTVVSDVDYLPFGPATGVTFGNGRTLDRTYDGNYGIAAIADSAVDGLALDYTLDAVGNVTGLDERLAGGGTATRSIDYDALDRLEALKNGATPIQAFTYDATGNRQSKTAGTTEAYTYPTTSHRLTQTGATARGYDAAGNTTTVGASRVFTYDDRGRMSQLTDGGVLTREYGYNARGERVVKRNPTVTGGDVTFVYDEAGRLLGEYDDAGARIQEYVWLDDTLVAVLGSHAGSSHQYVLTDHLGTPRAIVHPGTNAVVWRWDLTGSAFGDHAANEDPDGDTVAYTFNLRYPGQYFDEETGLHYNYFRDYDPGTGRYVQSDPIGLAGGASTYGYAGGNPAVNFDPRGQYCVSHRGDTLCHYPGGPMFMVPTPKGFPEHINSNGVRNALLYHRYDVTRNIGCKDPASVMNGLINRPTPDAGGPRPATTGGTANNAAVVPLMSNPVTSYLTEDLITGDPLVVNMAGSDGFFEPGYAARTVRNGVAHTYGEGLNPLQSPALTFGPLPNYLANELIWGSQMSDIISSASGCGCSE